MKRALAVPVAFLLALFTAASVQAGEVSVKGVHLCCGGCVKAVAEALGDVDGVSNAACDRDAKTVTFTADNKKAAKGGIKALAKAGFHGKATAGDKKIAFPDSGAKKGQKADSVALTNVHICCGLCIKALNKVADNIDGVESVKPDKANNAITFTGSDISVAKAVAALNKAGFHAKVKKN